MRSVVYKKYGPPDVLQLQEIAKPSPKAHEVLIKVHATTVTIGDCRMRSFSIPPEQWLFARLYLGVLKPKRQILGMELAGDIEAVGQDVTRFKAGDPVFASTFEVGFGGYVEYKCLPEDGVLALKPTALNYGEAAEAQDGFGVVETALDRRLVGQEVQDRPVDPEVHRRQGVRQGLGDVLAQPRDPRAPIPQARLDPVEGFLADVVEDQGGAPIQQHIDQHDVPAPGRKMAALSQPRTRSSRATGSGWGRLRTSPGWGRPC